MALATPASNLYLGIGAPRGPGELRVNGGVSRYRGCRCHKSKKGRNFSAVVNLAQWSQPLQARPSPALAADKMRGGGFWVVKTSVPFQHTVTRWEDAGPEMVYGGRSGLIRLNKSGLGQEDRTLWAPGVRFFFVQDLFFCISFSTFFFTPAPTTFPVCCKEHVFFFHRRTLIGSLYVLHRP